MAHLRFYLPVSDCNVLRREHVAQGLLFGTLFLRIGSWNYPSTNARSLGSAVSLYRESCTT